MAIVQLNMNDKEESEIWLNSAQIISMRRYDDYTHVRTTGTGDGKPYSINVTQGPEAIVQRIKDAEG